MSWIKNLKSVHYAIFENHLRYASIAWTQSNNSVKRLSLLQKKSQSQNSLTGLSVTGQL